MVASHRIDECAAFSADTQSSRPPVDASNFGVMATPRSKSRYQPSWAWAKPGRENATVANSNRDEVFHIARFDNVCFRAIPSLHVEDHITQPQTPVPDLAKAQPITLSIYPIFGRSFVKWMCAKELVPCRFRKTTPRNRRRTRGRTSTTPARFEGLNRGTRGVVRSGILSK